MDCISYLKIPQLQGCFFEVPPASRSFLAKMLTKDPKMRSAAQLLLTDAYLSQARAALCHPPKPGLDGSEESEKKKKKTYLVSGSITCYNSCGKDNAIIKPSPN